MGRAPVIARMAILLAIASCGDDRAPPPPGLDAGLREGGPFDAGPRTDAGPAGCVVGEVVELARGEPGAAFEVASAGGPESFIVAFSDASTIAVRVLPSDGAGPSEPRVVTEAPSSPRTPAAGWLGDAWGVVWSEMGAAGPDLHFRTVARDGATAGAPAKLTDDAAADTRPAITGVTGGAIAAWVRDDVPVAARIGSDGAVAWGPVALGDPDAPSAVAIAPLGEGDYFGAWVSPAGARVRAIGGEGAPSGSVVALGPELAGGAGIAAAGGAIAGAALFEVATSSTRADLRIQRLLPDGAPSGPSYLATEEGIEGRAPGLVRFAGGWAGAWRAGGLTTEHVRLGLFAFEGPPVRQMLLTPLTAGEGSLSLAVSSDGVLLVVWSDREAGSSAAVVRALSVTCRG